jgi:hypothetical protein
MIDFRSFLGNEIGTFKVTFVVSGVFSRIIAGQRGLNDGHWSIDHTNFAATEGPVLDDVFDVCTEPNFKNLVSLREARKAPTGIPIKPAINVALPLVISVVLSIPITWCQSEE